MDDLQQAGREIEVPPRNDAFSFWKLAQNWREALSGSIAESERDAEYYLLERYLNAEDRRPPSALGAYYRIRHLIPQSLRYRINSMAVRTRRRGHFPNWPCESALVDFWRTWLRQSLQLMGVKDAWHIGFWPRGYKCCIVLTHDVESSAGMARIEAIADIEERHGFRSSWNLVLAQYSIDWNLIARLRQRGFEFGAHGLSHDGRMFRSRKEFARMVPTLEEQARSHGLRGFRAPSTLRRAEWIAGMSFDFDLSFSDTDPWEPQPGGTCSLFPFYLGDVVELPYTMPQDHTLIHLLHRDPLQVWALKMRWIASVGGMILTLTHPDYIGSGRYLADYEELLKRLSELENAWRALPSNVAKWWRRRAKLALVVDGKNPRILGDSDAAVAVRLSEEPLASEIGDGSTVRP